MTDSFNRIAQGLQEAAEHARGAEVPDLVLHVPDQPSPDPAPKDRISHIRHRRP